MKFFRIMILLACSGFMAHGYARSNFDYDYVELGHTSIDAKILAVDTDGEVSAVDIEGESVEIAGSFDVSRSVNVLLFRRSSEFDFNIESEVLGAGVGVHTAIQHGMDIQLQIFYLDAEFRFPGNSPFDETGHAFDFGIRHAINRKFQLEAGIAQTNIDGDAETGFNFGGRFRLNNIFSCGASYSIADDTNSLGFGLRAEF